ncbi:hypothetical protein ACLSU7_05985 [Bdellovibrio sp. HCB185ZH]|uniref:hypothetical protein n=1 Tax=Bdellovibrio sp. HCB185ZH TaxID=3394235 RepID=UPI0039A44CE0
MIRVLLFSLLMISSQAFAAALTSLDVSYGKGDYGNVYHESGERYLLNGEFTPYNKFYIGYEHVERNYTSEVGFYRDALMVGDTQVFESAKSYVEFMGAYDAETVVGAEVSASLIPHTSYFANWDLALGLHYAKFYTGEVQTFQPQFIYFFTDTLSVGHSSWFYEDRGWHHAHREFFRFRYERVGGELSWAGGENREDIGIIDDFNSYSVTATYYHKYGNIFLTLEDYQGHLRSGSAWGTGIQWRW